MSDVLHLSIITHTNSLRINITITKIHSVHSKKCWVVLTQFWVKYGQTRNVGLKM